MKRWGAILLALALCVAAVPGLAANPKVDAAPLMEDTTAADGTIRVWLSTLSGSSYTITVKGDYTINGDTSRQLANGAKITVSFSGGAVYLDEGNGSRSMGSELTLRRHAGGDGYNALQIAQGLVPSAYYPGDLHFVVSGGKNYVIAHLYIEDYIYGVLPYEMDNGWPLEALKAQAVAARTYAVANKQSGGLYDVVDTTQDQVFRGVNYGKENCIRAVDETWGVVMKYDGEYVHAYYSASNGGQTETNSNYWGGEQLPYLQIKEDPFDEANPNATVKSYLIYAKPDYGTSTSAYTMIASAIAKQEGLSASQVTINQVQSVTLDTPKYDEPSRLYTQMTVKATYNGNKTATVSIPIFNTVENALSLKINNTDNELYTVVKEEKGFRVYARRWGHGVGMSQRGAAQMANLGYSYAQILGFYYTDVTRVRMEFARDIGGSVSGEPVAVEPTPAPVEDAQGVISRIEAHVRLDDSSERLNLREEPSTSADVLDKIPDGEEVEVLEEGEWAKIEYDGKTGYVLNEYLVYEFEPDLSQETVQEVTARVVLSSGTLNLREEASEDSERLEGIENGETLTVLGTQGEWSRVRYGKLVGYVLSSYLQLEGSAAPSVGTATVKLSSGNLNLRAAASEEGAEVGKIPNGETVEVLGTQGDWTRVRYGELTGYVLGSYLSYGTQAEVSATAAPAAQAGEDAWVICAEDSNVNLRKKASTSDSSTILARLPYGTQVLVTETEDGWCKVTYGDTIGYILAEYLTSSDPALALPAAPAGEDVIYGKTVWILSDSGEPVNVRRGAASDAEVLVQVDNGTAVTLINTINSSWYKVICKGQTGYVASKYVSFDNPSGSATAQPSTAPSTAEYTTVINSGRVDMDSVSATMHLRAAMDDLSDITGTLKQGESIDVLFLSEDGDWIYVRCGSLEGYMHTEFARLKYAVACVVLEEADSQLLVRRKASRSSEYVARLDNGAVVTVLSQSDDWSEVRTQDGTEGYVATQYLETISTQ